MCAYPVDLERKVFCGVFSEGESRGDPSEGDVWDASCGWQSGGETWRGTCYLSGPAPSGRCQYYPKGRTDSVLFLRAPDPRGRRLLLPRLRSHINLPP